MVLNPEKLCMKCHKFKYFRKYLYDFLSNKISLKSMSLTLIISSK